MYPKTKIPGVSGDSDAKTRVLLSLLLIKPSVPVLSESHMEAAIDQGSSCHLISLSGLVRPWLGRAKQRVE